MKFRLKIWFSFVLISMLYVTTWASLHENVFAGGSKILNEPWGVATLVDTYFGFFMFYLWVLYKETSFWTKLLWLLGIIFLGNIAMAVYGLLQIRKSPTDDFKGIFLRPS